MEFLSNQEKSRITVSHDFNTRVRRLIIKDLQDSDSGKYKCIIDRDHKKSYTFNLQVIGKSCNILVSLKVIE